MSQLWGPQSDSQLVLAGEAWLRPHSRKPQQTPFSISFYLPEVGIPGQALYPKSLPFCSPACGQ